MNPKNLQHWLWQSKRNMTKFFHMKILRANRIEILYFFEFLLDKRGNKRSEFRFPWSWLLAMVVKVMVMVVKVMVMVIAIVMVILLLHYLLMFIAIVIWL